MDHQENEDASDDGPSVASKVFFAELCGLLEKISKTQGNDKKKRIMKEFIDKWGDFHNQLHNDNKKTVSITENVTKVQTISFNCLRCHLRHFDRGLNGGLISDPAYCLVRMLYPASSCHNSAFNFPCPAGLCFPFSHLIL